MPREPLYPHIPKGQEPLFPHTSQSPSSALPCPICFSGKQKPRYSEEGLRYHLREFHKRIDVNELVKLAKELASEGRGERLPATTVISPEYRHLLDLVNEPLPQDAY